MEVREVKQDFLELTWGHFEDHVGFKLKEEPFFPVIYDGIEAPAGFNTICLPLNAGLKADLNWENIRQIAEKSVQKGLFILWELQLDLTSSDFSLTDSPQYLALQVALDYFRDTLWKEFASSTIGVMLYRGSIDLTSHWKWTEEERQRLQEWVTDRPAVAEQLSEGHLLKVYCLDLFIEYLDLLVSALPVELQPFLALDLTSIDQEAECLQLLSLERLTRFHLILKGGIEQFPALSWQQNNPYMSGYLGNLAPTTPFSTSREVGALLPTIENFSLKPFQKLVETLKELRKIRITAKLMAEELLTTQWDGLEFLLVDPIGLSSRGRRMLQGFCAAGGTVVSLGAPIAVSQELSLGEWIKLQVSLN